MKHNYSCPCSSKLPYDECCKKYHQGTVPENALLLMRSRFSAYALNLADYIIDTTHPLNAHYSKETLAWKESISEFSKETAFHKLKVHNFTEENNRAVVTFTAYLSQQGLDATFTERSRFEKHLGRWLYLNGIIAQGRVPNLGSSHQL